MLYVSTGMVTVKVRFKTDFNTGEPVLHWYFTVPWSCEPLIFVVIYI